VCVSGCVCGVSGCVDVCVGCVCGLCGCGCVGSMCVGGFFNIQLFPCMLHYHGVILHALLAVLRISFYTIYIYR